MKVLANETKRILAVLLSVAMIFAYVPNNVMAYADDDVSGNDTVVEDATEALSEEATEAQIVEDGVDNQATNSSADENGGSGSGDVTDDSQDYLADLQFQFNKAAGKADNDLSDFVTLNATVAADDTVPEIWDNRHLSIHKVDVATPQANKTKVYTGAVVDTDTSAAVTADSDNGASFILEPYPGYKFKDYSENPNVIIDKVVWYEYSTGSLATPVQREISTGWTITPYERSDFYKNSVKVTFPKTMLDPIKEKLVSGPDSTNTKVYGKNVYIVLAAAPTEADKKYVSFETGRGITPVVIGEGVTKKDATADFNLVLNDTVIENAANYDPDAFAMTITVKKGDATIDTANNVEAVASATAGDIDATGLAAAANKWGTINWAYYTAASDTITIKGSALADAYENDYDMTIKVENSANSKTKFSISFNDISEELVSFTKDGNNQAPDVTVACNGTASTADYVVYAKSKHTDGRVSNAVAVWGLAASDEIDLDVGETDGDGNSLGTDGKLTLKSGKVKGDTIISASTEEKVAANADNDHVTIYGSDAGVAGTSAYVETGDDYDFIVVPDFGYKVDGVKAKIATSTTNNGEFGGYITPYNDVYTVENVSNRLEILAETSTITAGTDNYTVAFAGADSNLGVVNVLNSNSAATDINAAATSVNVKKGYPVYFTIAVDETGKSLESLSYSVGGTAAGTLEPVAAAGEGGTAARVYYFCIPGDRVTGNIVLTPVSDASGAVAINAANTDVDYSFIPGEMIPKGKPFTFEISQEYENVAIKGVYLTQANAAAGTNAILTDYGTYTLDATQTASAVTLYVVTEKTITDGFFATYTAAGTGNGRLEKLDKDGKPSANPDKITSQTLYLVKSKTQEDLTMSVTLPNATTGLYTGETALSTGDGGKFAEEKNPDGTAKGNLTVDSTGKKVTVEKAGVTTSLLGSYTVAAAAGNNFMGQVYVATLPVIVEENRYDVMEVHTSADTIYVQPAGNSNASEYTVTASLYTLTGNATDGTPATAINLNTAGEKSDIKTIQWLFNKDITNKSKDAFHYYLAAADGAKQTTVDNNWSETWQSASTATNKSTILVAADEPCEFDIVAKVTFSDDTVRSFKKHVTAVEASPRTYFVAPTITGDSYNSNWATAPTVKLGMGDGDAKNVTVSYKVYEVLASEVDTKYLTAGVYIPGQITSNAKYVKEALDAGYIGEVSDVSYEGGSLSNNIKGTDKQAYITWTGSNGVYTFNAKAALANGGTTLAWTAPTIKVNGVQINATTGLNQAALKNVNFNVFERQPNYDVEFITYDDLDKASPTASDISVQNLKDSYFEKIASGQEHSVIIDDATYTTANKPATKGLQIGNAAVGVSETHSIKLPTAEDFSTTPASGRVLIGWQAGTARGTWTSAAGAFHNPGDTVVLGNGNAFYRAIWSDQYQIEGLVNGNLLHEINATQTVATNTKLNANPTVIGSNIPVLLQVKEVTGVVDSAATLQKKGIVSYKDSNFTLTATTMADTVDVSNRKVVGLASSGEDVVKLKAEWTPVAGGKVWTYTDPTGFKVGNTYTLELEMDDTLTLEAGQATKDLASKIYTKVGSVRTQQVLMTSTGGGSGATLDTNYNVSWTPSDSALLTVKGKEAADKLTAELTPNTKTTSPIPVKINVVDYNGKTAEATCNVTITDGEYSVVFVDENGAAIQSVDALMGNTSKDATETSTVRVAVKKGTNYATETEGTWGANATGDGTYVASSAGVPEQVGKAGVRKFFILTNAQVGEGKMTVKWTSSKNVTYQATIPVNTYAAIKFVRDTTTGILNTGTTFVTLNGTEVVDADGNPDASYLKLFASQGTLDNPTPPAKPKVVKFEDVNISAYSCEYVDDSTPAKAAYAFDKWNGTPGTEVTTANLVDNKFKALTLSTSFLTTNHGILTLTAALKATYKVSGLPATITLDDTSDGKKQVVELAVSPSTTTAPVLHLNTDIIKKFNAADDGTSATASLNTDDLTLDRGTNYTAATVTRVDSFQVEKITGASAKAGSATLTITADSDDTPLATATLYINGLDITDNVTTYYENGEKIKNQMRTVGTKTYVFGDDYEAITGNKVVDLENPDGSTVKTLIIAGGVPSNGVYTMDSNRYYVGEKGAIKFGWLTATGAAATAANGVYYADPTTGILAKGVTAIDGKTYYFAESGDNLNKLARASAEANVYEQVGTTDHYVNADGEVAQNGLFKVAGIDRLFRENGKIVKYDDDDVVDGKIKLGNFTYLINPTTHEAKREDVFYNPTVTWTVNFPPKYTKGNPLPILKYTVTYTSANTGAQETSEEVSVKATTTDDVSVSSKIESAVFTAVADLSAYSADKEGKTVAENVPISQKYLFKDGGLEGVAKEYAYKSHKFIWPKQITLPNKPSVSANVTYSVKEMGQAVADETLPATVAVSDGTVGGKYTAFTATLTDINGQTKEETQKYDAKGKLVEGGSGDSPSEPEEQAESGAAQNLFYTDVELSIPGFASSGAETTGTGKWTQYYSVGSDGTVTVIPTDAKTRKTAANASNSLIVLPIKEDGVQVGELHYALPVYYAKPTLKLSSTKGTIKKGEDGQSVKTKVSERKSNGAYEPLDLSDQKEGVDLYAPRNSSAVKVSEISTDGSEITIPATGKTTGKIQVQLDNWCDKVELNYTVAESTKDVLTVDKKTVYMNTTANAEGEAQTVTLLINGREVTSEDGIKVTYPNNFDQKNIEIGGVTDGNVEGSEITVAYKTDAAPVKGNYTLKFAKGTSKASVKISVSNLDPKTANKAVATKIQTKMNLTTGQKMVLIPQLKGIGGEISDVKLDSASAELFSIEYNEEVGQIYLEPVDVTKVNTTTQYKPEITITVGGVECKAQPKFKPQATKPAVKIDKVTLDKNKVKTATDGSTGVNAAANVLCTYKLGGKTFTIDPIEEGGVEFYEGNTKLTANASTGMYTLKNGAAFRLVYDKTEGILKLTDYQQSQGKGATVKVHLMFPGQTKAIVKNFSIKTK